MTPQHRIVPRPYDLKFQMIVGALLVIITALSVVTIVSIFNASNAVDALRTNAAHVECRVQVVNGYTDQFRQDITDLVAASEAHDTRRMIRVIARMKAVPLVNGVIDSRCPKPLVISLPKKTPKVSEP